LPSIAEFTLTLKPLPCYISTPDPFLFPLKQEPLLTRQLRITHDEDVAIVQINRPEVANAMNSQVLALLREVFGKLREDKSAKGIVITGEGKHFCAGGDIAEMAAMNAMTAVSYAELGQKLMFEIERVGKPVIAAVNGHAAGGGLELALACDFIVASQTAVFAAPEIRFGIIPGFGGTQRLARLVGKAKAKELIFTGNEIGADEAFAIGLANRVYPAESLLAESIKLMKTICSRGPFSLRLGKEIIDAGYDIDLANACLMERDAFALCFTTEDQKEGMGAFVEKRQARFKGK
jgi:enoyl-CoA hydratase